MTKRDLIIRISDETGLIQEDVKAVLQKSLDYIVEALEKNESVEFRNFGVFEVRERKERVGRNPNQPENDVMIPARRVVKFKPGKVMKQRITGS
ncbi:MAG: integration host factor subunit beta [Kiritimatiellaceae bacterium]|jgi:nucleoid DNA-binding protein|nr:integration host factor subunit beta [Kiritimatiellaceae bacterium]|tara:strand:+ start:206 stop:487 length:282 start_codon:yes stop_codon:yes gene_type:complete